MFKLTPKLTFLHGFLGAPEDWEGVISYLPSIPCCALSYPFNIPPDGILVGYSLGGRIASSYPHPKILISSHPGLATEEEKKTRRAWENKWLALLKHLPFSQFLEAWYNQPFFASLKKSPNFPALFERRLSCSREVALHQFETHLLSNQPYHISSNTHFLCGTEDLKYMNLYNELSLNPLLIARSSHACHLEQPAACAHAILDRVRHLSRHQVSQRS